MFEVGKKYTNPRTLDIALVLFADERSAYLNWQREGRRFHLDQQFFKVDSWIEYKEPRELVGYVNVWKSIDGSLWLGQTVHSSEEKALSSIGPRLEVIKIVYTEKN